MSTALPFPMTEGEIGQLVFHASGLVKAQSLAQRVDAIGILIGCIDELRHNAMCIEPPSLPIADTAYACTIEMAGRSITYVAPTPEGIARLKQLVAEQQMGCANEPR